MEIFLIEYLTPIGCSFLRDELNIEEGTLARPVDVTFATVILGLNKERIFALY
jgi:hypothetical protein